MSRLRFETALQGLNALVLLALTACAADEGGGSACQSASDCGQGQTCVDGICRDDPDADDPRRQRDIRVPDQSDALAQDPETETDADASPDLGDTDQPTQDVCQQDCTGRVCGNDPVCGAPCGPNCPEGEVCSEGTCVPDEPEDPLAALIPECATFCEALCEFLLACGKEDPSCLVRCGQSARYQALSSAACNEGTAVIGLEECRLWLDCGGSACAIDEMCLEVIPGYSYSCAPICDRTQSVPACTGNDRCSAVADAAGREMTALGMCWSLF